MKWVLRIFLAIVALIAIGLGWLMIFRPLEPQLVMSEPGETGRRIDEGGVVGNYFPAHDGAAPGILLVGGSEGGLGGGSKRSAVELQSIGYSVLHLSFYRAEGQPKDLLNVPLETFDSGLEWLKSQPEVDAERIVFMGASKGAEAGLIFASRRNDIDAAVLGVPSSVSWPGINWAFGGAGFGSSWSLGGEPYPYLPYGRFDREKGVYSLYENGLVAIGNHPDAVISVEDVPGPILLICGEEDSLWPSCTMARQVKARAEKHNGPEVTVLAYEDAGHYSVGVPVSPDSEQLHRLSGYGGSPTGNNEARQDGWAKTLSFLEENTAVDGDSGR